MPTRGLPGKASSTSARYRVKSRRQFFGRQDKLRKSAGPSGGFNYGLVPVVVVVTDPLPLPDATRAMPPATTPTPRTRRSVLPSIWACLTPAGLPGASGALELVAAKELETTKLDARMAA